MTNKQDGLMALGVLVVMLAGSVAVMCMFPQQHIAQHLTTTPAPAPETKPVLSIFALLDQALETELRIGDLQWVHAAVAAVFGAVAIANGEFVFKWLIVGAVFVAVFLLTMSETSATFGPRYPPLFARIVALEAAAGCAYATFCGISGVMLAVGALLGVWLARKVQMLFTLMGYTQFESSIPLVVIWYTVLILFGMRVMRKRKYMTILGLLSSAIGGALLTSSIMWFATWAVLKYCPGVGGAVEGAWVDFLQLLLTSKARDVGIWTKHAKISLYDDYAYPLDRVVGCGLWLLLFVFGSVYQYKKQKELAEHAPVERLVSRTWSTNSWLSSARERTVHPLEQPILAQGEEDVA